eukprot:s1789_g20.t1
MWRNGRLRALLRVLGSVTLWDRSFSGLSRICCCRYSRVSKVRPRVPRLPGTQLGSRALQRREALELATQRRCFSEVKPKAKRPLRPKEELLRDAAHHDVPVRRRAVKDLGKYRDDPQAIEAIAKALGDEDVAVQLAAQGAMSKVAELGDERTVKVTLERVSSTCEWTRIAALSTLADITGKFGHATRGSALDLQVDAAVKGRLEDSDWGVRRAAIDTMASRAQTNCQETLEAAKKLLEDLHDQMGTVRESAIKAIASLVPKGSREAIDWVSPRLDDWHESVRRAAVASELVELVELVESSLESSCNSCTSRLRRLGPVLWQAALLQLELVEEMLPKKVEVPLHLADPCHDRYLRRHWRKLQKSERIGKQVEMRKRKDWRQ